MVDMNTRSPLRELYDQVAGANDWSTRDVERRIAERGMKLSKSRIGQIVNAWPLESVNASWVYALAAGLGVAPSRVAIAAVQSMGFQIAGDDLTPAEAIARDASLNDATKRALLSILRDADEGRRGA